MNTSVDQILISAPPDLPEVESGGGVAMTALPMLGSVGSMAVMLSMTADSGGGRTRMLLAGGVFLLTTLVLVLAQLERAASQRRTRLEAARSTYLDHLADVRRVVREHAHRQRTQPPAPLHVRLGCSRSRLDSHLVATPGSARADPVCAESARRLVAIQQAQPALVRWLDLGAHRQLSLRGEPHETRAVARAIVCAAAELEKASIGVLLTADPSVSAEWEWLKWLPLSATNPDEMTADHLVVVSDGQPPPADLPDNSTVLNVLGGTGLPIECGPGQHTELDHLSVPEAEARARRVAHHPRSLASNPRRVGSPDLLDLLHLTPDQLTGSTPPRPGPSNSAGRLCVPLGITDLGEPVVLDLKESASGGMGPHGLVVGATGSGKSELLRTLVVGLALTHPPAELNLVLVDFKGGATFAGLAALPHVSALVTNLGAETVLVDRMQDALEGELVRRQELLRAAGDLASITQYDVAREAALAGGQDVDPLPALLIVIDEFAELLTAKPEFLDTFLAIGRLGRSLGIHLLLASQRLEEGRLRGLEAHLSYRVGLRTFSEAESRTVLGTPDAAHLPPIPGLGFLRAGPSDLSRFTAAYVSGPLPRPASEFDAREVRPRVVPFVFGAASPSPQEEIQTPHSTTTISLLEAAVASLAGSGSPAHRIWLPPLTTPLSLGQLLSDLSCTDTLGMTSQKWRQRRVIPLGVIDRPREQRREILSIDLAGASGHVVVVGAPRSGKSTLLATFVVSLSLLRTPAEARIFVIDQSGTLAALAGLPHVAGLAGPQDHEIVRRSVAEVGQIVADREAGAPVADDVFLVIDGWDRLVATNPELAHVVHDLGARGLAVNVHLVLATSRWADLRMATRELFGSRLELRQGDPLDSEVDRRAAAKVPAQLPGRGLLNGPHHFLAALPRLDPTIPGVHTLTDVVRRVADAWAGPPAPPLRLLPLEIASASLPDSTALRLGVRERDLSLLTLPDRPPHLLIFGEAESGKSSLLRQLGREVCRRSSPREAQLVVIDPRRSLLGEFAEDHLLHYATTAQQATQHLTEVAAQLVTRLPGDDLTPELLRTRSWWSGPDVVVLVDDYDLMVGAGPPLAPLIPLLAQAGDVGLHLYLSRRTGGASRALFEPVIQALRDLGTPGVLLSGSAEEGPLIGGVRASPAPPGRAHFVSREGAEVCQIAWSEPRV